MSTMSEALQDAGRTVATAQAPSEEFRKLSQAHQRELFFRLPESVQETLVSDMSPTQLKEFVRRLDSDEATDVLGFADEETRTEVLRRLDDDRREKINFLLEFDPETAAGLMHLDYILVGKNSSLSEVAQRVRRYEERTEKFPTIFVIDGDVDVAHTVT